MYYKKELGNTGEQIATDYLRDFNYEIVENNFWCKSGEIDIIAVDKSVEPNELVFIEVKTRTNDNFGNPADAVNYYKIKHMYRAAEYYVFINELEDAPCRFDVIEVFSDSKINHIKKAILDRER